MIVDFRPTCMDSAVRFEVRLILCAEATEIAEKRACIAVDDGVLLQVAFA
jgi:hypothetical protein